MPLIVEQLKQNNRLCDLNFTICIVGSRKLSHQDDIWRHLAPNLAIYGFDADADACEAINEQLEEQKINWKEKHFPLALSDQTGESTLYVTKGVHCSSLYPPNESYLSRFLGMREGISLNFTVDIETTTLDDFCRGEGIENIDFLQLDVQGAELNVLRGGEEILSKSVVGLKVEVEFSPLYQNAPLFSDIDGYLRDRGFLLFDLNTDDNWCYRPRYISPIYSRQRQGQLLWADAFYLRDPFWQNSRKVSQNPENILKLACIADILEYPDYCLELLEYLTINYGDDPRYNFAVEILNCLSQFPNFVEQGLHNLPIIQNIRHRLPFSKSPSLANFFQLADYQDRFLRVKQSPYLNYPAHVHLETMALCNASCNFCPYPTLERQGTKMSDELIDKIISDLEEIPKDISFQLSPFKVNEPFLDKRLFAILGQINSRLPHANLAITSNASVINQKILDQLVQVKNVSYLWISFNDHREKEYEKVMALNYQNTIKRLKLIHENKSNSNLSFRVVLSRVEDRTNGDQEFIMWVRDNFPLFEVAVTPRGNWLGQKDVSIGEIPDVACNRWFELSITATGKVAHCCMDGKAEWLIGDVTKQSVLEVYNHPDYRRLREEVLTRLDVSPCNQCTFL